MDQERNQQEASIINGLPSCFRQVKEVSRLHLEAGIGLDALWTCAPMDLLPSFASGIGLEALLILSSSEESRLSNCVDRKIEQRVTLPKLLHGVTLLSSFFHVKYQNGQWRTLKSCDFLFLEMIRGFLQGMSYL